MKKIFTLLLCAIAAVGISSCNDDDDTKFAVSGEGYLSIDSYSTYWMYRMAVMATETDVTTHLLGGVNSVTLNGTLVGRGSAIYFSYDATDASTLTTRNLTIGEDGAEAGYATYINFDSDSTANTYTSISSGTIVVSKSGSYYRIRILGIDVDGRSISIAYEGYIYALFTPESDSDDE